jgi:glycosyltransferase involved in cell wall biosynthesis
VAHADAVPLRHVALVAHSFLPDATAGVEQYTARLARALPSRGVRASVICGRVRAGHPQNAVLREQVDGIDVVGLVQNWPYRDLPEAANDAALDRAFDRALAELAPDLVAIQTLQGLSWGFPSVAAGRGIPVVMHLHDAFASCASGGQRLHPDGTLCLPVDRTRCGACFDRFRHREGPLERASRWAAAHLPAAVRPDALHRAFGALPDAVQDGLRKVNERAAAVRLPAPEDRRPGAVDARIVHRGRAVDAAMEHVRAVISPSRFLADSVRADGIVLPRLTVVPTGAETAVPRVRPRGATGPGGPLRVLFLGTWVAHKGPHVLADALAMLSDEDAARIEAHAHGPAPFPAYRDACAARSGGRLVIGAAVPAPEVPALLAGYDAIVVPSVWAENAPLVVLEARAAGCPVVASDLGGLVELVEHGVDGLRFPAGDADALADVLRALLHEPGLREGLADTVRPPPGQAEWVDAILRAWSTP